MILKAKNWKWIIHYRNDRLYSVEIEILYSKRRLDRRVLAQFLSRILIPVLSKRNFHTCIFHHFSQLLEKRKIFFMMHYFTMYCTKIFEV